MPPLLVAGHLCQLTHTSASGRSYRRGRENKAVAVILPAPVYNSLTGDVYELPATIKVVDGFPAPAGFRRQGTREASFMYSIGVYVETIDEKTAPCQ